MAAAIECEVRLHNLCLLTRGSPQGQPEAFARAPDLRYAATQKNCATVIEFGPESSMHLQRQAVAMGIPEWPHVAQKAGLLLDGEPLPDVPQRGTQAV